MARQVITHATVTKIDTEAGQVEAVTIDQIKLTITADKLETADVAPSDLTVNDSVVRVWYLPERAHLDGTQMVQKLMLMDKTTPLRFYTIVRPFYFGPDVQSSVRETVAAVV